MKSLSRGPSPLVTLKVPQEMFDGVERWRFKTRESRSEFIRNAIAVMVDEYECRGIQWDVPGGVREGDAQ